MLTGEGMKEHIVVEGHGCAHCDISLKDNYDEYFELIGGMHVRNVLVFMCEVSERAGLFSVCEKDGHRQRLITNCCKYNHDIELD